MRDLRHYTAVRAPRALVVAQDRELLAAVAGILQAEDYEVESVDALSGALARLATWLPDAIILDSTTASGVEPDVREHLQALRIPTVVLGSRPGHGPHTALSLGADAFFTAPVFIPDLLQTLGRLCSGSGDERKFVVLHGDRRSPFRPKHGDLRPCLRCGGAMRFKEADAEPPAWICANVECSVQVLIRAAGR